MINLKCVKTKIKYGFISTGLIISIFLMPFNSLRGFADIYTDAMETNKTLPIQSNEIENWPAGPTISAYSAVLMDADTGVILYEKNSHEVMYPASTTKLMTCLLALENKKSNLNDMVKFSYDAVMSIPRDGSNMGMDAGESMTLEECLYGILVVSANEVANAVAEYVSGDIDSFVKLMNDRAKELGCVDTHFNNPHGYSDPDHYTSAYDLALIGREFFKNELLAKISRTPNYHWYATDTQPDDIVLGSTNYFMKGRKYCEGLVGSKTGFTDESRQCLVSAAERNGIRLICVVMSEETPYQYDDTLTLFNYGFSNFDIVNILENETRFTITNDKFFHTALDVFGDSSDILTLDNKASLILPKTSNFEDLTADLSYKDTKNEKIATINYSFNGVYLGSADILFTHSFDSFEFDEKYNAYEEEEEEPTFIYINHIIYALISIAVIFILIMAITRIASSFHFGSHNYKRSGYNKKKRSSGPNYTVDKKRMKTSRKKNSSSDYIDFK